VEVPPDVGPRSKQEPTLALGVPERVLEERPGYLADDGNGSQPRAALRPPDEGRREIGRAAQLLKVTPAAASHNINKLVEAGILAERTGRRRGQVFVAMDIVRIVDSARKGRKAASPET
jgi:hypothetical protein